MEIHTSGACWSVGHTTVQGHRRGRGPSYRPLHMHTHIYCMRVCASAGVCVCVCRGVGVDEMVVPAGQLKYRAELSAATAWDFGNT